MITFTTRKKRSRYETQHSAVTNGGHLQGPGQYLQHIQPQDQRG